VLQEKNINFNFQFFRTVSQKWAITTNELWITKWITTNELWITKNEQKQLTCFFQLNNTLG